MGHSDIVSILLIILTILANGAVVNAKIIVKRSIQDIANDYLKSFPEPINKTRNNNNVQDVEVFVKKYNSNNEVGEGQLSFKLLNRKATDSFVQSRSDTVDNVDVEMVEKPEELMKTGTEEEHIAAAVTSYFIPQTQSPDVTSQFLTSDKPSCAFTFNSTKHTHSFEVDRNLEQEYFISVVVEKMNCSGNKDDAGQAPILSIKGAGEENAQEICKVFDSSRNNFQSVDFCIDGGKHVTIIPVGNWSGVSASLVVTLYYETLDGCDSCTANNHFCCGNANAKCPGSPSYRHFISNTVSKSKGFNKELSRCILKPKRQDGKSLFCDGHPNCGLYSNKDELGEFCPNDEYDYNTCYTCRIEEPNRILLTILLILVFCVFVPFCIFFVFCTKREVRSDLREDGRCPLLIEILFCPFSMNADNQNGVVRVNPGRRPRPNPRPPVRRSEEVNRPRQAQTGQENFSFLDDLPPPYSVCCNNKSMYPNPNPPNFPKNLGAAYPSEHEFRNGTPAANASVSRTVPTVSLQVLTISSLVSERPPPSFEVVSGSSSRSKDNKKKELTRDCDKSSRTDASNNSNVAAANYHS